VVQLGQRRTQEQRSSSTQDKLARAAFVLIREFGYANFRVASVGKEAGVSQGGQLHHFPTKDSMTMAVIEYAIDIARQRTEVNLSGLKSSQNLIATIAEDSRDYYFSDSFDVAMDVTKGCVGNSQMRHFIAEAHRAYRDYAESAWCRRLLESGWTKADAQDVIAMTASLVRGFAIRAMIRPDDKQLRRLLKRWQSMVEQSF
jgi:AcrR family transcriptional regulator